MDTTRTLHVLRAPLRRRGIDATGPYTGSPSPTWGFLHLPDGRHCHAIRDENGYWQVLVYDGRQLVRMADADAKSWPGDRV